MRRGVVRVSPPLFFIMSEQDRNKLLEYLREQLNSDDTSEDMKGALEALIDSLERQKHTD